MGVVVYFSCALAALGCAVLLLRAYRRTKTRLLLWSAVCFTFLTLNNMLIAVDLIALPEVNLLILRNLAALAGIACMLWGLIWDTR